LRVLVIGNGAREHAISWKFSQSKRITGIFVGPGNAGTEEFATNVPDIDGTNSSKVIRFCKQQTIDLVFVGPEVPLSLGLVDDLEQEGIKAVGPKKKAAQLESSKAFSKQFMTNYGIPTAPAVVFTDPKSFTNYLKNNPGKQVIKMSGLAAGKGVLESDSYSELLSFGLKGLSQGPVLVEEFLEGYEISIFALTDGKDYKLLPICTDYKKSKEGNTGSNTGGMGSICPVPWISTSQEEDIIKKIVIPTFKGFDQENFQYKGIVYFGIMITEKGPYLLEYNVRFGDPEAQVLIPLIENDFCNLCEAMVEQSLERYNLNISPKTAVCVVVASLGYPQEYKTNLPASLPQLSNNQLIFHAGTYLENGTIYTNAGRCFSAVGLGNELLSARSVVYPLASRITFPGAWFRKDIGNRIFE
jgi:phosphoribosylamine--glycine ligase